MITLNPPSPPCQGAVTVERRELQCSSPEKGRPGGVSCGTVIASCKHFNTLYLERP